MAKSAILTVMERAARKAGRGLARDFGEVERLQVSTKGPGDFVSDADRRAEERIYETLKEARPDWGFLGEEGGTIEGSDKQHRWIVDPLDGTTNFLHSFPYFAVSIGLERDGEMVAALVYNPITDELFSAEKGRGAYLNDTRLRVANRRRLADAILVNGFPHLGRGDHALWLREAATLMRKVAGMRRMGSASLDLSWVAAGRIDGHWEADLSPWDMAAGLLMVREAGGIVRDTHGGDAIFETGSVVAGNDLIVGQLLKVLKEVREAHAKSANKRSGEAG
ncbi:MAG: inositol monophosphatase, partial [Devosiaceae bacterium]|nr:inositol monophosphatase [Devosiaceae bacterium MH13]